MPDVGGQARRIAVYGASGYTGRLVAAELGRRGADFVLAGRSRPKLEMVAEDVAGKPHVQEASLDDPAKLRELLEPCAAVIACAGPFVEHGEPVVRAAIESGTHYLDTTGEQPFIRRVFQEHGPAARAAGVALVPAMGFDYAFGDLIAALTGEGLGDLDEVAIAYSVLGWDVIGRGATRGTARSAIGILTEEEIVWDEGELRPARGGVSSGTFEFPAPLGRQRMVRYPSGEHITVPRHLPTRRVRTMLTAATMMPHPRLSPLAPTMMLPLGLAARTPLRRVLQAAVSRLPEGPSEEARSRARFLVVCDASAGTRRRRGSVSGSDVYGITARTIVEGALRVATADYRGSGALAPAQAFDPRDFLNAMGRFGVEYEVEPA